MTRDAAGLIAEVDLAARALSVRVRVAAGEVTALVGPNGAGKSTVLSLIAGLLRPDAGRIAIDGAVVSDASTFVEPRRRPVALLEQRPLLFPHLDVAANVAFGPRARGTNRHTARQRAEQELAAVGASDWAARRPEALSGGQAQRVALARALATDPAVVLLDEPFAALDVDSAAELRQVLGRRLRESGAAVLLVTHDPLDLWSLADRVIAIESGRVVADGPVAGVLGRPPTPFLARLSGTNLLTGVVEGDVVSAGGVAITGVWDPAPPALLAGHALAALPPQAVALFRTAPHGSPRNTWPVTVSGLLPQGPTVRVDLALADGQVLAADLTAQAVGSLNLRTGDRIHAQVKATQVHLYPRP